METTIDLLVDFDLLDTTNNPDEAFASVNLNPSVAWAKFILTDDRPNINKQRVPIEEFDNLVKTGIYMPIKMAEGEIKEGHNESFPLGVITHLKKNGTQVLGLAALWKKERTNDVAFIKEKYDKKEPLQLSWEILFGNSTIAEDGTQELRDVALRAVTFVGAPAYAGRTPILSMASENKPEETTLEDNSDKMEELEQLKSELASVKTELATVVLELEAKKTELSNKDAELSILNEYKSSIEKKEQDIAKLAEIKTKFSTAGITKDDEYFETNKETLFSYTPESLDFMIQELVSFSSMQKSEASTKNLPPINGGDTTSLDYKNLAKFLREKK